METYQAASDKKTVLGIIGSQRKLGNCELFVKEVSRNIPFGHDLKLVRLPALDIRPCNGCYRCVSVGTCSIEDDLPFLIDQVAASDALIIASPVYFLGTHASVKQLLDRAFAFFSAVERIAGKPTLLVNTYGMKDRLGTAPQALLSLASFLALDVRESVDLRAALPGDVLTSKQHVRTAARLAGLLAGRGKRSRRVHRACPFCGNHIIRMRKNDFICTLCHGDFTLDDQGMPLKGDGGWDVGSIEFVRAHREWLKGMKAKFLANKRELLTRTLPYRDMGQWVGPDRKGE
jgi:NAD(P)H-dependent FMN reductase